MFTYSNPFVLLEVVDKEDAGIPEKKELSMTKKAIANRRARANARARKAAEKAAVSKPSKFLSLTWQSVDKPTKKYLKKIAVKQVRKVSFEVKAYVFDIKKKRFQKKTETRKSVEGKKKQRKSTRSGRKRRVNEKRKEVGDFVAPKFGAAVVEEVVTFSPRMLERIARLHKETEAREVEDLSDPEAFTVPIPVKYVFRSWKGKQLDRKMGISILSLFGKVKPLFTDYSTISGETWENGKKIKVRKVEIPKIHVTQKYFPMTVRNYTDVINKGVCVRYNDECSTSGTKQFGYQLEDTERIRCDDKIFFNDYIINMHDIAVLKDSFLCYRIFELKQDLTVPWSASEVNTYQQAAKAIKDGKAVFTCPLMDRFLHSVGIDDSYYSFILCMKLLQVDLSFEHKPIRYTEDTTVMKSLGSGASGPAQIEETKPEGLDSNNPLSYAQRDIETGDLLFDTNAMNREMSDEAKDLVNEEGLPGNVDEVDESPFDNPWDDYIPEYDDQN